MPQDEEPFALTLARQRYEAVLRAAPRYRDAYAYGVPAGLAGMLLGFMALAVNSALPPATQTWFIWLALGLMIVGAAAFFPGLLAQSLWFSAISRLTDPQFAIFNLQLAIGNIPILIDALDLGDRPALARRWDPVGPAARVRPALIAALNALDEPLTLNRRQHERLRLELLAPQSDLAHALHVAQSAGHLNA